MPNAERPTVNSESTVLALSVGRFLHPSLLRRGRPRILCRHISSFRRRGKTGAKAVRW